MKVAHASAAVVSVRPEKMGIGAPLLGQGEEGIHCADASGQATWESPVRSMLLYRHELRCCGHVDVANWDVRTCSSRESSRFDSLHIVKCPVRLSIRRMYVCKYVVVWQLQESICGQGSKSHLVQPCPPVH
jgi:hypothetical protein